MKKAFAGITMLCVLMLVASVAVAQTINISWFVNTGATGQDGFNTWVVFKNVSSQTFTLTIYYYDDDNWGAVATSPTVVLAPGEVSAHGTRFFWTDTVNGTNQGSLVVTWNGTPGNEQNEIQGYVNILNNALGYSTGVMFIYPG